MKWKRTFVCRNEMGETTTRAFWLCISAIIRTSNNKHWLNYVFDIKKQKTKNSQKKTKSTEFAILFMFVLNIFHRSFIVGQKTVFFITQ